MMLGSRPSVVVVNGSPTPERQAPIMNSIVEYFTRHITLVLDNEQSSHDHATAIARDIIREDGITAPEWHAMDTQHREEVYAPQIGEAILAWLEEVIGEVIDSERDAIWLGEQLIREIMIWSDSELEYALGSHYMPEDSDMVDLLPDGDEDEEEEELVTSTCQQCGLAWQHPRSMTLTRSSRPCGWSH